MEKRIVVHIQPDLAPSANGEALEYAVRRFADGLVLRFHRADSGFDDGPYVNVSFTTKDLARGWWLLRAMYTATDLGPALSKSTIVTCEGDHGWDDYLLLYHFDPGEVLDELE